MKVLILAAGYATRLYPLTLTQPKPLLPVAGKPMIEHVLDHLEPIGRIDRVYVVTNARFAGHFQKWADHYRATKSRLEITIVNDGSTDETNKLGAIGDLHFVLSREKVEDDLLVVAGDNLFSQSLAAFGEFCRMKNAPVLGIYDVGSLEEIKKYNSISMDDEGRITFFEEKPKQPASTLTGIALYYPESNPAAGSAIHRRGKQSGPTRSPGPMAVSENSVLHLDRSRNLVRHRLQRSAGRSEHPVLEAEAAVNFVFPEIAKVQP